MKKRDYDKHSMPIIVCIIYLFVCLFASFFCWLLFIPFVCLFVFVCFVHVVFRRQRQAQYYTRIVDIILFVDLFFAFIPFLFIYCLFIFLFVSFLHLIKVD